LRPSLLSDEDGSKSVVDELFVALAEVELFDVAMAVVEDSLLWVVVFSVQLLVAAVVFDGTWQLKIKKYILIVFFLIQGLTLLLAHYDTCSCCSYGIIHGMI
jgi:hypothetical protein